MTQDATVRRPCDVIKKASHQELIESSSLVFQTIGRSSLKVHRGLIGSDACSHVLTLIHRVRSSKGISHCGRRAASASNTKI